jgi:hypothetical protein
VAEAGQRAVSPALWAAGLGGLVVAVLTVTSRPPEARGATAALLVAGLAAGAGAGLALARAKAARHGTGARPGRRTVMERMNDGAFGVVLLAAWGVSLAVLGPWAGLLAGLGAGLLVALVARRG